MAKRYFSSSDEEDLATDSKHAPLKSKTKRKPTGHWSQGLLKSMENPDTVVKSDEKCVMINDMYPKARHHYLILPRENISGISSLGKQNLELLHHLLKFGQDYVKTEHSNDDTLIPDYPQFKYGYHAIPSMNRLHMHVISCDFDSPSLKNKKHWNSFTTDFFIDAARLIKMVEEKGRVVIDKEYYESLLKKNLSCHVCRREQRNMPTLKSHIRTHFKK
ncbi:PREDICTED: aprataxin-like [Amphimedon queenslandica]|uniref:HIT domain-containing protein n=1 Tax=Amphimedon queenslandica TaxID=400682 RepID=A0A1X7UPR7_AMPQE|nr:PREDICTED: aprataxin-like [Amphimedon queenslandica]|eukprot:XP_003387210.3 PREDICTED: aprataxin-like [Amphimedon queenslandica]